MEFAQRSERGGDEEFVTDPSAGTTEWRVSSWFDGADFAEVFARFLDEVDTASVRELTLGYTGGSYDAGLVDPVPLLAAAADRFPALRSLHIGDSWDDQEISWIEHGDLTPVFEAFPALEELTVTGASGLGLDPVKHAALTSLRFRSGGLPAGVVRSVAASDLPALERLHLWLGTPDYGGDSTVDDLAGLLTGERLPSLRHLGLEDSEIQDDIATAVAGAPVVARLETLSLAMGTLTDRGAEALLSGQPLTHLASLDLHHHYLSEDMQGRVRRALARVEVNLDDQEEPDEDDGDVWLYCAVAE